MSESISKQNIFDLDTMYETERKFIPLDPSELSSFMCHESTTAIEQIYLSTPHEPYSLRLRSTTDEKGTSYEATLKDRGVLQAEGIHRLEVTTAIPSDLYAYYADKSTPCVRKLRAEPIPGVTIDFYEDGTVQIESENEAHWSDFKSLCNVALREVTGLAQSDNEQRAYKGVRSEKPANIATSEIIREITEKKESQASPVFVHIGGRSGSGKSTIVHQLVNELNTLGITSELLSTDDYHRGQSWLMAYNNGMSWERWDDPIVYDTETMAIDLHRLAQGQAIKRRAIDWRTVEPQYVSLLPPADVIIIEGIYALAPEIIESGAITRELQTPLATCVGRRLIRDIVERPKFADPVKSLNYMLSEVEPAYRKQRENRGAK